MGCVRQGLVSMCNKNRFKDILIIRETVMQEYIV